MLRWVASLGILASCGRVSFDPQGDGTSDRPNVVFLSMATPKGDFGGVAAADLICSNEASAAGLPGTFLAFLSDASSNARDRFASSRGWTLRDGTPIGDTVDSMLTGQRVLNALDMQADGMRVATGSTWTGSSTLGISDASRECANWSAGTDVDMGNGQSIRSAQFGGGNVAGCASTRHVLCFEVGHVGDVPVAAVAGRYVFLTSAKRTSAINVPAADSICSVEASSAGLPGTYLAALNTSTTSVAARFTLDTRPWIRVDGTQVAAAAEMFTGTDPLESFVIQHADGTYQIQTFWTGVATTPDVTAGGGQTCMNWASATMAATGAAGQSHQTTRNSFWSGNSNNCNTPYAMMCMQE